MSESERASNRSPEPIDRRRLILHLASMPLYFVLLLFLPAGTWQWMKGWVLILVLVVWGSLAWLYIYRVNPELLAARINRHQGTKRWDKILLGFFFTAGLAVFPVAALDDGRLHWFPVPWQVCLLGYVLLAAGMALITWAEGANKFFEPTVRIQIDRGHTVVDKGPYALVRHPGYAAACLIYVGFALSLGSLWALIPALVTCLLLVLRTRWEDQTLQAELAGYRAYAERVRYKWVPGLW